MNALLSITKLVLTVLGDQPTLPRINWLGEEFEILQIDNKIVALDNLKSFSASCLAECKRLLGVVL
jgi:hypothetical protein